VFTAMKFQVVPLIRGRKVINLAENNGKWQTQRLWFVSQNGSGCI
jgi:hypothetical protein